MEKVANLDLTVQPLCLIAGGEIFNPFRFYVWDCIGMRPAKLLKDYLSYLLKITTILNARGSI